MQHISDKDAMRKYRVSGYVSRFKAFKRFRRVFFGRGLVIFGIIVILSSVVTAIFAPILAPYDPYEHNLRKSLLNPCKEHILGTDRLGRDTFSRLIYGSRASLLVGIFAISFASIVGMMLGLIAGFFGGITNATIMRIIDGFMSFPMLLLALCISALLGGGIKNVVIALSIGLIPNYTRLMCAQVIAFKERDFIMAAIALGASNKRLMFRHLVPNCFPPIIVLMTMMMGHAILAEAGLSFLGVGISPPGAAWGAMVNDGYEYLLTNPILSFAPGFAIMLVVFSFNMVGDGLRDALDPRLRGAL
jgi:ABC-type dipeptide/oligopeptide/nickel transport system permease subunit